MSCLFVGSIPEGMICDMILKRGFEVETCMPLLG